MKVLITGICGFLGTHVAELFKSEMWEVYGIDNLNKVELERTGFDVEKSRQHNIDFLNRIGIKFAKADCRYIGVCGVEDLCEGKPDFIIHCAAQPAMTIALEIPEHDADNNILGCLHMLDIAKHFKIPFVNCSSIHVYGNDANNNLAETSTRFVKDYKNEIDESEPILQGELTPLHVSKYTTELYTKCFAEMYGIRTASFRFTGMYGERQFGGMDHGWVANFAIRTIMSKDITVFGTDKQVRDILYARDAARAFLLWYMKGSSGVFNIGGGMKNAISLGECLYDLRMINNIPQNIHIQDKRKGDLWYFVCDYKKAKKDFGWEPTVLPNEGLERISDWIINNKDLF